TKDFAARVGHSFAHKYQAKLVPEVYQSLLDLVAKTEKEIADLEPRDRIAELHLGRRSLQGSGRGAHGVSRHRFVDLSNRRRPSSSEGPD
ncbi:MAG TPA: hypothetical protein VFE63_08645, partial [Roseiarcus sp.]|nr:hypothetical protein [Roseiarcus sp.]